MTGDNARPILRQLIGKRVVVAGVVDADGLVVTGWLDAALVLQRTRNGADRWLFAISPKRPEVCWYDRMRCALPIGVRLLPVAMLDQVSISRAVVDETAP